MAYQGRRKAHKRPELIDRRVPYKPSYFFLCLQTFENRNNFKNTECWETMGSALIWTPLCPLSIQQPQSSDVRRWTNSWMAYSTMGRRGGAVTFWIGEPEIRLNTISDTKCWVTVFHLNTSLFLELQNPQKYTKLIIPFIWAWSNARRCWLLLSFQTNACHVWGCIEGILSV
jgi:hypothetical protein